MDHQNRNGSSIWLMGIHFSSINVSNSMSDNRNKLMFLKLKPKNVRKRAAIYRPEAVEILKSESMDSLIYLFWSLLIVISHVS